MRMPFELFVALRYLFSRRKQTFIYIISIMSILGVALGVGALVVVLGVYNGLTTDMRDKIIGANAHGIVMSYVPAAFQQHPDLVQRVEAVEHVRGATPFIYTEVMLSAAGGVKGLVLRGIDPESAPKVLSMLREIRRGSVTDLKREGTPGIIIGEELAKRLGIGLGSRVNLLSPSGEKGATGYSPRIRPFEVVGIFKTGMFEYDATLAFDLARRARHPRPARRLPHRHRDHGGRRLQGRRHRPERAGTPALLACATDADERQPFRGPQAGKDRHVHPADYAVQKKPSVPSPS